MIQTTVSGNAVIGCIVTNFSEAREVSIGTASALTDLFPATTIAAGLQVTMVKKAISDDPMASNDIFINNMDETDSLSIKYWF